MEKQHKIFEKQNANFFTDYGIAGYLKKEDATEYSRLFKLYWGSNLVVLGVEFIDGYYFPQFNVFD